MSREPIRAGRRRAMSGDYYETLGVERQGARGRDQEGLSPPGPQVPPGPQSRRQVLRSQVQGDPGGLFRPERSQEEGPVRPLRISPATTRPAEPGPAPKPAVPASKASTFPAPGGGSFQDFFANLFGGAGGRAGAARGPEKGEDLFYTMAVGFEDAVRGLQTKIQVHRPGRLRGLRRARHDGRQDQDLSRPATAPAADPSRAGS